MKLLQNLTDDDPYFPKPEWIQGGCEPIHSRQARRAEKQQTGKGSAVGKAACGHAERRAE